MPHIDRDRVNRVILSLADRNFSAVIVASRTISHSEVARRLGIPKQTYQDWREGELPDFLLIAAAYGLKLVPADDQNYSAADIAAMSHLAQKGILALKPLPKIGGAVVLNADEAESQE